MVKLLSIQETEEIINTMLNEYGLVPVCVVWNRILGLYETPDVVYKTYRFLGFKWTRKVLKGSWVSDKELSHIVIKIEKIIQEYYEPKAEQVIGIRERHTDRLMNRELKK